MQSATRSAPPNPRRGGSAQQGAAQLLGTGSCSRVHSRAVTSRAARSSSPSDAVRSSTCRSGPTMLAGNPHSSRATDVSRSVEIP